MKAIVCISGKAQHGKDSTANILKDYLGDKTIILHFADLLKMIAQKYLGWDGTKSEAGRTILQELGSNRVRWTLGWEDYWVRRVCEFIQILSDKYDYFFIPDCRYPNEYEIIRDTFNDIPVIIIRVVRNNFDNGLTYNQKTHLSETSLDNYNFDYVIESESGLDNLEIEVKKFMQEYFNMEA